MDLIDISSAGDLLAVNHPHFGKLQNLGFIKRTLGILTGTSRKADALEDYSSGQQQSVALHVDAQNFMITIADAFVLVTLREGSSRHPVILKNGR